MVRYSRFILMLFLQWFIWFAPSIALSQNMTEDYLTRLNISEMLDKLGESNYYEIELLFYENSNHQLNPFGNVALKLVPVDSSASWLVRSNPISDSNFFQLDWYKLVVEPWNIFEIANKDKFNSMEIFHLRLNEHVKSIFANKLKILIEKEENLTMPLRGSLSLLLREMLNDALEGDIFKYCDSEDLADSRLNFRKLFRINLQNNGFYPVIYDFFWGQAVDQPVHCFDSLAISFMLKEKLSILSKTYQLQLQTSHSEPKLNLEETYYDQSSESPKASSQPQNGQHFNLNSRYLSLWAFPTILLFLLLVAKIGEAQLSSIIYKVAIAPYYLVWGIFSLLLSLLIIYAWSQGGMNLFKNNPFMFFFWPTDILFIISAFSIWFKNNIIPYFSLYILLHVLSVLTYVVMLTFGLLYSGSEYLAILVSVIYLLFFYIEFVLFGKTE